MPALDLNSSPAKCEMVATPKEASDSLSGLALAAATSSATSLIGLSRWVTSTIVMVPVWAIGSKSLALSYGTFSFTAFCKVKVEFELENRVYPSGAAWATSLAAIVVPPPGRLSTITGLPRRVSSSPAMMRPTTSEAPPAGNGTINCSGFSGKLPCAVAIEAQATTQADVIAAVRNIRIMSAVWNDERVNIDSQWIETALPLKALTVNSGGSSIRPNLPCGAMKSAIAL